MAYTLYRPASGGFGTLEELRREMDALMGRSGPTSPSTTAGVFPAANLYETADAYMLTAELPGLRPEDIEVSLEGDTVTLHGERKLESGETAGAAVHRRERQSGTFRRAFALPVRVDAEKVEAVHRNGVLMLRLPKAAEHKSRQISVQTG